MIVVHGRTSIGSIIATIDDVMMTIPDDMSNSHRRQIAEWESQGNAIPEYNGEVELSSLPPVSHAQIIGALIIAEIITEVEGIEWIKGNLPQDVKNLINRLPTHQRTIATLRAIRPSEVMPTDSLVLSLGLSKGKSDEEMVSLFQLANTL